MQKLYISLCGVNLKLVRRVLVIQVLQLLFEQTLLLFFIIDFILLLLELLAVVNQVRLCPEPGLLHFFHLFASRLEFFRQIIKRGLQWTVIVFRMRFHVLFQFLVQPRDRRRTLFYRICVFAYLLFVRAYQLVLFINFRSQRLFCVSKWLHCALARDLVIFSFCYLILEFFYFLFYVFKSSFNLGLFFEVQANLTRVTLSLCVLCQDLIFQICQDLLCLIVFLAYLVYHLRFGGDL